jgi:hypothetical protein
MGISHYAVFGIGYQIKNPDKDDIIGYLDGLFDESDFECESAGNYMCDDDEDMDHYVFIKELDILNPTDILAKKELMEKFFKEHGLEIEGEFGLIGGAQVM